MIFLRAIIKFFGLADKDGDVSFNKSVTAFGMAIFAIMVVKELNPSPWVLGFGIVLVGAGFGLKGYLGGVNRLSLTGNSSVAITGDAAQMIEAAKRRDVEAGIDPA
ncbi:MAG: hypothetical protein ACO1Q7_02145 [Gemmatimonas sp.]